jgi:hypothetical protein
MRDGGALGGDDPFDEVADGNEADEFVVVEDGQVPDAFVRHEAQTFIDAFLRMRDLQIGRHDFGDFGFAGAFAVKHDFPRVIAYRNHPDQLSGFQNKERADVFVGHHFNGFENGGVGRDRKNFARFLIQDGADVTAYVHESKIDRPGENLKIRR